MTDGHSDAALEREGKKIPVGLWTRIQLVTGLEVEGQLYTTDAITGTVVLQSPSSTGSKKPDFRIIKASAIKEFHPIPTPPQTNGAPSSTFRQPTLGTIDIEQVVAREKQAIQLEEERLQRIGLGVPKEGNDLFEALSKTLPVQWVADHIVIMDEVAVSPPYSVQMVKAVKGKNASAATLDRVRKVVEGERKKLGLN